MAKELEVVPSQKMPRTVVGAKIVELALVSYQDESNQTVSQLAVVGENEVHLLESRVFGLSKVTTRQGPASAWMAEGVMKALGKKKDKA